MNAPNPSHVVAFVCALSISASCSNHDSTEAKSKAPRDHNEGGMGGVLEETADGGARSSGDDPETSTGGHSASGGSTGSGGSTTVGGMSSTGGSGPLSDHDTDGDCRFDADEWGPDADPRDTDGDGSPDYLDLDSDNDGLDDYEEDDSCDGKLDDGETDATRRDTDGDGFSDGLEDFAGSDPLDDTSTPLDEGALLVEVENGAVVDVEQPIFALRTPPPLVDLYLLADLSGSMADEWNSMRDSAGTVIHNLTCAPAGAGAPGECLGGLWSGFGVIGDVNLPSYPPYSHLLDLQPSASVLSAALAGQSVNPTVGNEATWISLWSTLSGRMVDAEPCSGRVRPYPDGGLCSASPAGPAGEGYPCFRPEALPVVVLMTDEGPGFKCPASLEEVLAATGAKVVTLTGTGVNRLVVGEYSNLALTSGAIDSEGNAMVFDAINGDAATALEDAIKILATRSRYSVELRLQDDPATDGDALKYVERVQTHQAGTEECPDGHPAIDTDDDGHDDRYEGVVPGTNVCFEIVAKSGVEPPPEQDEFYRAEATVLVEGSAAAKLPVFVVVRANE